ncbi:ribonucleases P/MRP protein subunit POP1-domain-containing protein [Xylariaceae sp. FL0255]|nr:ribonucleases P/MRP protein subunit POP1-domain-containing protein [Xylariaceae sp. FL0255]
MAPSLPSSSKMPKGTDRPNKRKDPPQGNGNGRGNKRHQPLPAKEARIIPVQPALKDGELNVHSFVNSMAFEINALDESMRRSRTWGTRRAFQRVPFTMRRRTAAHNYKKVPKRLQRRAKREMAQDNTPIVNSKTRKPKNSKSRLRAETARKLGILAKRKRRLKEEKGSKEAGIDKDAITTRAARPKIRTNAPNDIPVTATRYKKRQRNKHWLPTHIWHAKRARMTVPTDPLWGFTIPLTPTLKNYRPNHRAQWQKGAVAWDMSYMSTIGLYGKENSVHGVLKELGLIQESLWTDRGKRWRAGAVHWFGNISRQVEKATHVIGPATIIWNPRPEMQEGEQATPDRHLFIRIHPSTFQETFDELLRLIKAYKPRPYVQDLRHEIGSIEVTGPDATEALLGVLKPSQPGEEGSHAARFKALLGLRDPASLPLGSLLAFSILDPRLTYPPRKVELPQSTNQTSQQLLLEAISSFRTDGQLQPYELFDRDTRFKASKIPSQKSINRRRSKLAPGTTLAPSANDPPIPIVLLACRNSADTHVPGTWTVMLPWKCVSAVWNNLMHYPLSTGGNPSFGGLDEIRQLQFERGQPWFPGDVPGTAAGNAWETRERLNRKKKWESKPRGKRVNWDAVDLGAGRRGEIGTGWACDFETLFGVNSPEEKSAESDDKEAGEIKQQPDAENLDASKATELSPPKPLTGITHIPKSTFNTFLSNSAAGPLPPNSVVPVRIKMLGRGTITTCARIYRLPGSENYNTESISTLAPVAGVAAAPSSSLAEVPGTIPPPQPNSNSTNPGQHPSLHPSTLRSQWLAQQPRVATTSTQQPKIQQSRQDRIQALAQTLVSAPHTSTSTLDNSALSLNLSFSITNTNSDHPPCPDAKDLIGFVTAEGGFNLRNGRGEAIGSIGAEFALSEIRRYSTGKGKGGEKSKVNICKKGQRTGKPGGKAGSEGKGEEEGEEEGDDSKYHLVVVRDAGQSVGWLARWQLV